jgi:signal transduction histidine kinase
VVDDGHGVPPELSEAIFTAYLSAHARTGRTDSVGLGLSIARELARRMGGDLTYERSEKTTVFELHLPRAESDAPVNHPDADVSSTEGIVADPEHVPVPKR